MKYLNSFPDYTAYIDLDFGGYVCSPDDLDNTTHVVFTIEELRAYERALIDAGLDHFDFDGSYRGDDYEPDYNFSVAAARRACKMPDQPEPGRTPHHEQPRDNDHH